VRLLLRGGTPSAEPQALPADLLADGTLALLHLDCPGGRIVLPGQSSAECDLHCALCDERTVVDRAHLLLEVGRLLTSETGTRAVVTSPGGGVVEITWEAAVSRRRRRRRKRDEGEGKTLRITIVVLVLLVSAFLLYGIYLFLDTLGAFDSWKEERTPVPITHGGTSGLSPLSRLNYDVQIVTPGPGQSPDGVHARHTPVKQAASASMSRSCN